MMAVFKITCPIKAVIGFDCPTCGTTRAMLSLLKLDFEGYLYYNPMAIFLVSAVMLFLFADKFKHKNWIYIYGFAVIAVNLIVYIIK